MPGIDFQAVRRAARMQDVLNLLRFDAKQSRGDERRGPCPLHRSQGRKGRTFSANVATHTYQCFQCGSKGNQLDLWANANGLGHYDAAISLCKKLGIEVPWIHRWKKADIPPAQAGRKARPP
jgi:DNA primase